MKHIILPPTHWIFYYHNSFDTGHESTNAVNGNVPEYKKITLLCTTFDAQIISRNMRLCSSREESTLAPRNVISPMSEQTDILNASSGRNVWYSHSYFIFPTDSESALIGSSNRLGLNRRQAISWTNDDQFTDPCVSIKYPLKCIQDIFLINQFTVSERESHNNIIPKIYFGNLVFFPENSQCNQHYCKHAHPNYHTHSSSTCFSNSFFNCKH